MVHLFLREKNCYLLWKFDNKRCLGKELYHFRKEHNVVVAKGGNLTQPGEGVC
ncbi:MAG: hypothetical protein JWP81_4201 [Ferruginibacter sp.]|nr:hypothetical protein [Ferruginibacter sp.]